VLSLTSHDFWKFYDNDRAELDFTRLEEIVGPSIKKKDFFCHSIRVINSLGDLIKIYWFCGKKSAMNSWKPRPACNFFWEYQGNCSYICFFLKLKKNRNLPEKFQISHLRDCPKKSTPFRKKNHKIRWNSRRFYARFVGAFNLILVDHFGALLFYIYYNESWFTVSLSIYQLNRWTFGMIYG
jgi:hypothetical protein